MPPYKQVTVSEGVMVRTFRSSVPDHELEWHMDRRDRHIRVLGGNGWGLQLESGLPFQLVIGETYFIPKKSWHRVIKGNGNLMIEIKESKEKEVSTMRRTRANLHERNINIVSDDVDERFRIFLAEVGMRVATMEAQGYSELQRQKYIAGAFGEAMQKGRESVLLEDAAPESLTSKAADIGKWLSNSGFFQGIQGKLADMFLGPIAEKMGIPKESFAFKVLHNVAENMDIATVQALIAGKGCVPLAEKFAGALQESVVETIRQQFGVAQSTFGNVIAEALQAAFVEKGPLVKVFSENLCKINFMDIVKKAIPGGSFFGGGDEDKQVAGTAPAA